MVERRTLLTGLASRIVAGSGAAIVPQQAATADAAVLEQALPYVRMDLTGDGATDNYKAMSALLAKHAGKRLYLPRGDYVVNLPGGTAFTWPSSTALLGDGPSTNLIVNNLHTPASATSVFEFEPFGSNFRFHDFKITVKKVNNPGGVVILWRPGNGATDAVVQNVEVDGNVMYANSKWNHRTWVCYPANDNFAGFLFEGCSFHDVDRAWVKGNEDRGDIRDVSFIRCRFKDNWFPITFNAPSSVADNILFDGCLFENLLSRDAGAGGEISWLQLGSVSNARVVNCHARGRGAFAHLEEKSTNIIFANNIFSPTRPDDHFLELSANNIGDGATSRFPTNITVTGNQIAGLGKGTSTAWAIRILDGTGTEDASRLLITGNIITGFESGLRFLGDQAEYIFFTGNVVADCRRGVNSGGGATRNVAGNRFIDCTAGLWAKDAGHAGDWGEGNLFTNCTADVSSDPMPMYRP